MNKFERLHRVLFVFRSPSRVCGISFNIIMADYDSLTVSQNSNLIYNTIHYFHVILAIPGPYNTKSILDP